MANVIVEHEDSSVIVSPIPGEREAFVDAANALLEAGDVVTVTGPRGIALRTSEEVAKAAGLLGNGPGRRRSNKKVDK